MPTCDCGNTNTELVNDVHNIFWCTYCGSLITIGNKGADHNLPEIFKNEQPKIGDNDENRSSTL